MKRIVALTCVLLLVSAVLSFAQETGKTKTDRGQELKDAYGRGKALFVDTSLGANGMSCNSCHAGGGTETGKMGDMEIPPFEHVGKKYPMYFEMAGKVMTLDQVINFCVTTPMEGKALAWDDQKLADLAVYITWVNAKKEKEHTEGMEHKEQKEPKK